MAGKPKTGFWIAVGLVVAGLVGFSLFRAGYFSGRPQADQPTPVAPGPSASSPPIQLAFYSSSAKKNWIDEMVREFNQAGFKENGRPIRVKAVHVNSGDSLEDLKTGRIKPDLWSPGDESWLRLAEAHFRDVKQRKPFDRYDDLVNIPLVIAMWEPMAKVLGYPGPIGWTDVAAVAADPQGWAAHGHPEWGRFRWGHAHPDANSGFLTVISEAYAATGKTDHLSPQDLKDPKVVEFLRGFEGAVEHYGLSNSWIDELMRVKGPGYLSATVQYENTIIQGNEKFQNKPFKLVAIYPREGNFWTRHPVAVLNEEWVTPEKAKASRIFVDFLLGEKAQRRAMAMGLRPIRKDLALGSPFDQEHGILPGVDDSMAFAVPDEAVLKRIRDLWEEVKVPATIIMVLDRSGSMKGQPIENAKKAAVDFINSMKPRDVLQIVVFNQNVTALTDLCSLRDCGEEAGTRMQSIFAEGKTALYDAIHEKYDFLIQKEKEDPHRRYAVLVLSDGKDTSSRMKRYDFLDTLPQGEEFDVPKIYTIAYGPEADRDLLAEISNRTNGRLFRSDPSEIARTYKELSANF